MLAKNAVCVYETMGIAGEWEFETKVGKVSATLFDHWVAIRCKDLERAKTIIPHRRIDGDADMNPYSGKWNIQSMDYRNYACIADFRMALFTAFKERVESII